MTLGAHASYRVRVLALLIALVMLLAAPADAEFSAAECSELTKLFNARNELAYAMVVAADAIPTGANEASRPQYHAALSSIVEAEHDCFQAQRHLFNAAPDFPSTFADLGRPAIVARAMGYVATCQAKTDLAARAMRTASAAGIQNNASMDLAREADRMGEAVTLTTFDSTLPFVDWRNASYPRVIGPHGDYDRSQLHIAGLELKLLEAMKDFIAFYGQVPVASPQLNRGVREVLRYAGSALGTINRIWFIDHGQVIGFADQQAIAVDTAAGSGLRPDSFFRFLRQVELIDVFDEFDTGLAGRPLTSGITTIFALISDQSAEALYGASSTSSIADVQTWLRFPTSSTFATADAKSGRIREFYQDFAEAWHHLDALNAAWVLFYHQIPAPPEMGVICGAGTHLKGTTCVADPAPPCLSDDPAPTRPSAGG